MVIVATGDTASSPKSPVALVKIDGDEIVELFEMDTYICTGNKVVRLDETSYMTCFEDRDPHSGPLEISCAVYDIDLEKEEITERVIAKNSSMRTMEKEI